MKIVKCILLLAFVSFSSLQVSAKNPFEIVVSSLATALKTGNAKELSAHFMNNVSLSLKRDERVYTRFQAELLINDFFRSNKVTQLKELQRAKSSTNSFVVFSLRTNTSTYRVFVKLIESNNIYRVSEFRVE